MQRLSHNIGQLTVLTAVRGLGCVMKLNHNLPSTAVSQVSLGSLYSTWKLEIIRVYFSGICIGVTPKLQKTGRQKTEIDLVKCTEFL